MMILTKIGWFLLVFIMLCLFPDDKDENKKNENDEK